MLVLPVSHDGAPRHLSIILFSAYYLQRCAPRRHDRDLPLFSPRLRLLLSPSRAGASFDLRLFLNVDPLVDLVRGDTLPTDEGPGELVCAC